MQKGSYESLKKLKIIRALLPREIAEKLAKTKKNPISFWAKTNDAMSTCGFFTTYGTVPILRVYSVILFQ